MKKIIAILLSAVMIMPMAAYASENTDSEEQEEGPIRSALGNAFGDAFGDVADEVKSAYDEFKDDVGTAVQDFGYSVSDALSGVLRSNQEDDGNVNDVDADANNVDGVDVGADGADDENGGENEARSYGLAIQNILNDFQDTIGQLQDDLEAVYKEVGDTYGEYVENKGYISDWYEDCITDSERLFDRTACFALEYYKYVASSVDRDYDSLDAAIEVFYDEILDEAFDDFYDAILGDAFDDLCDRYYNGIIDEGYDLVDFSDYLDECSDFYSEWINAYSELYSMWISGYSSLYSDWMNIWSEFIWNGNFDADAILAPSEEDILTADNCPEFAEMLACEDSSNQIYEDFYDKYQGDVVEFDGSIVLFEPDSRVKWDGSIIDDEGYYDIMICPGDYDESLSGGPQFLFDGTTAQLIGYGDTADTEFPSFIDQGSNVHVVARLVKYDDSEGICYLKPVSVTER